jgi:hypothetical protein
MSGIRWLTLLLLLLGLSGCLLTKVATVPMRVGGALASVVPVVGNPVHDAIDTAADAVDTETAKYRGEPLKQGVWRRTLCS